MQHTPVFLPEKSHGQRSLVGYSPWGRKELDMTERQHSFTVGNETGWETWGPLLKCLRLDTPLLQTAKYKETI